MSLSDLASIGSLVSGMAVLVSLIFLYIQLREIHSQVLQAEKNQRAMMNQGVISRGVSIGVFLIQPQINYVGKAVLSGEPVITATENLNQP